ncbi:MAG TPA: glycerophosphodiester phosphodiesterase [Polyangiaceae bacterium]|nr:glycerophosphodiester phosphodiesterase [Polyangiaceae bacterium]
MSESARRRRPFLDAPRPLLFAHRGGGAAFPENTLLAFENALAHGIRFLETDVHLTKDGVLVAHHDARVDRTTNGTGKIADYTYAELSRLDAGYHFTEDGGRTFPYRGEGVSIPTLLSVFSLSRNARLNVEIKPPGWDVVKRFWELIDGNGLHDRVLVAAENDVQVRRFRRISRETVATSAGRREAIRFVAAAKLRVDRFLAFPFDALQVPAEVGGIPIVDPRFVRAAHRKGIQVHVWTIDEPHEMRRLLNLGVDGIMSDYPDRLAALGKTMAARGRAE